MPERFLPKEVIVDPNAPIRYFIPERGGLDRFGNRLFTSEKFAYLDGAGNKTKAGLLVSPDGQDFMRRDLGILKDVDRALAQMEPYGDGKSISDQPIDMGNGRSLRMLKDAEIGRHLQSNIYLLVVDGRKYIIKTHLQSNSIVPDIHQPYINEMLQTQHISEDLRSDLENQRVRMATFLFASGQVSCTLYEEEDAENDEPMVIERFLALQDAVIRYVEEKKLNRDPLWEGVKVDSTKKRRFFIKESNEWSNSNIRVQRDGTIVWVDPFKRIVKD